MGRRIKKPEYCQEKDRPECKGCDHYFSMIYEDGVCVLPLPDHIQDELYLDMYYYKKLKQEGKTVNKPSGCIRPKDPYCFECSFSINGKLYDGGGCRLTDPINME